MLQVAAVLVAQDDVDQQKTTLAEARLALDRCAVGYSRVNKTKYIQQVPESKMAFVHVINRLSL